MFVYLGGENVVDAREVVAILDARRMHRAVDARTLLARVTGGQNGDDLRLVRALVVTTRGLMLTTITVETAARRIRTLTRTRVSVKAER